MDQGAQDRGTAEAAGAGDRISPEDLATCLRVLDAGGRLYPEHPDSVTLQRAVGRLFKEVKRNRRRAARDKRLAADRAVIEATATGSADRIDDETLGLDLKPARELPAGSLPETVDGRPVDPSRFAGRLIKSQNCYICKKPFTLVDRFHHQLCPECADENRRWRDARCDLTGRRALLTGGRAKIGMHIALRLLRDGAHLTVTTRFPKDAVRRFAAQEDSAEWLHRLRVIGIDLRDPAQVVRLADEVAAAGPLDILINNAAQTVRRSAGACSGLVDGEAAPLDAQLSESVDWVSLGSTTAIHPGQLTGAAGAAISGGLPGAVSPGSTGSPDAVAGAPSPDQSAGALSPDDAAHSIRTDSAAADALVSAALTGGSASLERVAEGTAVDAGGLIPDLVAHNSWVATVGQVDPVELLEVQLCNSVAPFILVNRLRPAMEASTFPRKYVVNVSAMEGVFGRGYKGPGHPHTNMAKAALNMLTRTSSSELREHGILMTAVDTGWITDERPHVTKERLAKEGFHAPLDLIDGAARVYHPIVAGETGGPEYSGVFLKDYEPSNW
ncbi:SDR family NAD(P)-dependent oxidoreductase [Corynebacterium hansenii]|uniref:SDR family NAD(P)-dependent oxidoreductase n=1 Tax=Corynebacterium hansenii TaxID=394964 RepID=A0ABV7ZRR4_9CORY|nr:SDR family NAD(P)-dependent oxidoreductase [Corynebacterium hansenii]WJZ00014.1 3-ketoacyl-(acyl-carrier-protein) reductase [Corynebacterium hansenii]